MVVGPLYSLMPFNISTLHLDNLGMINDCKDIAEVLIRDSLIISENAVQIPKALVNLYCKNCAV